MESERAPFLADAQTRAEEYAAKAAHESRSE